MKNMPEKETGRAGDMSGTGQKTEALPGRNLASLSIPARRDAFEQLRVRLLTVAEELRIPERETDHLLIAADEVFSNIAAYAYPGGGGTVEFQAEEDAEGTELRLIFSDRGIPFDPLAAAPPDTAAPIAERRIGGLGIHVVRKLMDRVAYRRTEDGKNVLTLVKRLPTPEEARS